MTSCRVCHSTNFEYTDADTRVCVDCGNEYGASIDFSQIQAAQFRGHFVRASQAPITQLEFDSQYQITTILQSFQRLLQQQCAALLSHLSISHSLSQDLYNSLFVVYFGLLESWRDSGWKTDTSIRLFGRGRNKRKSNNIPVSNFSTESIPLPLSGSPGTLSLSLSLSILYLSCRISHISVTIPEICRLATIGKIPYRIPISIMTPYILSKLENLNTVKLFFSSSHTPGTYEVSVGVKNIIKYCPNLSRTFFCVLPNVNSIDFSSSDASFLLNKYTTTFKLDHHMSIFVQGLLSLLVYAQNSKLMGKKFHYLNPLTLISLVILTMKLYWGLNDGKRLHTLSSKDIGKYTTFIDWLKEQHYSSCLNNSINQQSLQAFPASNKEAQLIPLSNLSKFLDFCDMLFINNDFDLILELANVFQIWNKEKKDSKNKKNLEPKTSVLTSQSCIYNKIEKQSRKRKRTQALEQKKLLLKEDLASGTTLRRVNYHMPSLYCHYRPSDTSSSHFYHYNYSYVLNRASILIHSNVETIHKRVTILFLYLNNISRRIIKDKLKDNECSEN